MILGALLRYRGRFMVGTALLLATNAAALAIPMLLRGAVEALRAGRTALPFALGIGGVATLQALVRTGSRLAILGASRRIAFDLRNRFYAHLQRLPVAFYDRNRTGDLMSRAVNDMMSVRSFFGPGVMNVANTVVIYVAALAAMAWISPVLTLAALLPLPFLMFTVQRVSRRLYGASRTVQESLADLSDRAQENLTSIQMIRTFAREPQEIEGFNRLAGRCRKANMALARVRGLLIPLMSSLGGVGTLIALWIGGRMVASGRITLGDFVAFSGYLALLVWPTVAMGWVINSFQRGLVAMRRLQAVLDEPGEEQVHPGDPAITELFPSVHFAGLTLAREPGAAPVLQDLEFQVAAGETVALVGPIGSGKSTVAGILARFVAVPDGTVFVGGHDINRIPLDLLRRTLGYAPQEAFLFSRSLGENIGFGLEEPEPEAVETAARVAGLARDLSDFPDGLNTRVGEGGLTLSGGQRQRTALARALVLEPPLLVLDDALSSVDAGTEKTILEALRGVLGGRTALIIAHRMATVAMADRILVLDQGRLVESGTHAELMAAGGVYARMARRQAQEQALESAP